MEPIPQFKLGARIKEIPDPRNFRMKTLLLEPEKKAPKTLDLDALYPGRKRRMYGNDKNGCCVLRTRACQTEFFERIEQGGYIEITDKEVLDQYYRESGGIDSGLYPDESLNSWRKEGWIAGGRRYYIDAWAQVDETNVQEVRRTADAQVGVWFCLNMPDNWYDAVKKGRPWSDTSLPPNPENGHCVLLTQFTPRRFGVDTWAENQWMTLPWFKKYCPQVYGAIDKRNENIDVAALQDMLKKVSPAV